MCFVHNSDNSFLKKQELSTEEWKTIFDEAIQAGMLFALFTGGECLLREDFEELYLYLFERGIIMSINTNGLLLNESRVSFFEKYPPRRLKISIYGSDNDSYERVTGFRAFEKVERAFSLLDKYHIVPDIAVTLSQYLYPDFSRIIHFLNEKRYPIYYTPELIDKREQLNLSNESLTEEEIVKLLHIQSEIRGQTIEKPDELYPKPGDRNNEVNRGMICDAGRRSFGVLYNGYLVPCISLPELHVSLKEKQFSTAWKQIVKETSEIQQPSDCNGCFYKTEGFCDMCPAVSRRGLYSVERNENHCNLLYRLCEEGFYRYIFFEDHNE